MTRRTQHRRRIIEGSIYTVRSAADCTAFGIETNITNKARGHMVLVLGPKLGHANCWRIMTITSSLKDLISENDHLSNFIPFDPTPKKRFPMQLKLANVTGLPGLIVQFDYPSYLRIDEEYYIHSDGLEEALDRSTGYHYRILTSGARGLKALNMHLKRRMGANGTGEAGDGGWVQDLMGMERLAISR